MRVLADRAMVASLADPLHFTGRVWRTDYIEPEDLNGIAGLRLLYEPGARSFWHVHEREQAIIAVYGIGLVYWEGLDQPVALAPGDWWHVRPGVPHWHGATPEAAFAHLAVTAGGRITWLHEVQDADYKSVPLPRPGSGG